MKALTYHGAKDVRVETVPDAVIEQGEDIILPVTATAICGPDLDIYRGKIPSMERGDILGTSSWESSRTRARLLRGCSAATAWCRSPSRAANVDLGVPEMDGFHLNGEVRRNEATRELRSIAMSGFGRRTDARRALEAGFDAHLPKPASIEELKSAIARL